MLLNELSVIWRERNMAIWRGKAMFFRTALAGHVRQPDVQSRSATFFWMTSMLMVIRPSS